MRHGFLCRIPVHDTEEGEPESRLQTSATLNAIAFDLPSDMQAGPATKTGSQRSAYYRHMNFM